MLSAERIALLKHGAPPRNALEAALRNAWYGGGTSYEKTVGPAPILSISDAKAKPAKSLIVGMEPIQAGSGDPSPDNIRPITGRTGVTAYRTGKNLLSPKFTDYFVSKSSAYRCLNGVVPKGEIARFTLSDRDTTVNLNGAYIGFVADDMRDVDAPTNFRWVISNGSVQSNMTNVLNQSLTCENVLIYPKDEETFNKIFARYNVMIELGSTATDYEPYVGASYPVVFPDAVGTVYGGTVDVVTGVLTVTHGMRTLTGSAGWGSYGAGEPYFCANISIKEKAIGYQTSICNEFRNVNSAFSNVAYGIYCDHPSLMMVYFRMPNADVTTLAEFKAWVDENPIQLCYELATPQTYQLTPQQIQLLKGSNTLWSDADDLTLTYLGTTPANLLGGMLGGGFGGSWTPPADESEEGEESDESDPEEVVPDGE